MVKIRRMVAGIIFCAAAARLYAGTPAQEPDVRKALTEMAELEKRIEQTQQKRFNEEKQLLRAGKTLASVRSSLEAKTKLGEEGRQYLDSMSEQGRREMSGLQTGIEENRRQLDEARRGARLAGAALTAANASAEVKPADLLALALLQNAQRDRAQVATERVLRLEGERADLAQKHERVQVAAQYHSAFAEYGLEQLRQRHEALARQVAELQSQTDKQSQTVQQLAGRHEELKQLLLTLAAKEASRVAQATPTPKPAPTPASTPAPQQAVPPAEPAVAVAQPTPVSATSFAPPAAAETQPPRQPIDVATVAEVPYEEGNAPMVSRSTASDAAAPAGASADKAGKAGTRYLFWRARPVGVRALGAGHVIFAGPFAGYRHLLIIDHGGAWCSLYGNLTDCSAAEGQQVQADQTIGHYQAERNARAEPLWVEVRQGVTAVEPETWPGLPADWARRLFVRVQD